MIAMRKAKVSLTLSGTNMLPTMPVPDDLRARPVQLTDNARVVLQKRYVRRGEDGKPAETEQEMFWRVAYHVALAEAEFDEDVEKQARVYYDLLTNLEFFPNSPTFTGAGTPLGQLAACFVIPIEDDMGRSAGGIFQTLRDAALIQQTGGGNGFAFSRLRPKGAIVKSSNGEATGPLGFLRVYDQAFGEIAQGGCLLPDTLVFTERGLLRLDEIVTHAESGWKSHDMTVATDEGARLSTGAYNNGVAPVLKVTTDVGLTLTGTPNHKVKIVTPTGLEWRQLSELMPGDAIMVKMGQHQGRFQALRKPQQQHGNQIMPQFPSIIDEEFAFFLGYMAGDGFVAASSDDHRIGVSVAHTSYLIEEMPALMQRLFGSEISVRHQQKVGDASVTFVIDNRAVKDFLLMNGIAKAKSEDVCVPRAIRQSPAEVVGAFLRGLLEADGSPSHHYPSLMSVSEQLIREVATLFIGLGCPVKIGWLNHEDNGHWGKRRVWSLRVHSFIGLENWQQRVGCDPRSRFAVCLDFRPDLERESSFVLPHASYWVEPVLDAIQLPQIDKRGRGKGRNFHSTSPKLQKQLLRYVRGDRQLTLSGYKLLAESFDSFAENARPVDDLWFVSVMTVESAGETPTLDIEVEGNHTYLANGIVTHNSRRGANMAVLKVSHPDIKQFITCKSDESHITNFNISVGITDEFMAAVEADGDFNLINPQDGKVWQTVRAREVFDLIVKQAHHNGEPGVLFLDAANRANPVPHLYELESTNPCGEQFLGPYENCCLGSINLAMLNIVNGKPDWDHYQRMIETSTRFLDDVVTANSYVSAVPQLAEAAHRVRRIGLGIMGLGDLMYKLGVRYGSEEGQEFAGQVSEFLRYHAMRTSIELAKERGAFPAIEGSIYDPANLKWEPPTPLFAYKRNWGRPALDWEKIVSRLKKHGIRNGAQTTVAPTGTIATVSGCEAYGCEPVFALAYVRNVNDKGNNLQLQYTSPRFEKALHDAKLSAERIKAIIDQVNLEGTCQNVADLPASIRHTFVVSSDISAEEHIRMQAAMQRFIDNAISKTCNFPAGATTEDVAKAYRLGWKLGCKGLTVYVTGSRDKVVLETNATAKAKEEKPADAIAVVATPETAMVTAQTAQPAVPNFAPSLASAADYKKHRPRRLDGRTYRVRTPLGTTYITVNENGEGKGQPFELFLHTAKAGSETAAVSEAIGRLSSLILRLNSPVKPRERLKEIIDQLNGIGGGRSTGFGADRVRSLPDGVAQALQEYIEETYNEPTSYESPRIEMPEASAPVPVSDVSSNGHSGETPAVVAGTVSAAVTPAATGAATKPATGKASKAAGKAKVGDLCPECGEASVVNEEGCRKCYSCSFSEC
jgi:ribonucleoside-diphosphate reductase alpha chain